MKTAIMSAEYICTGADIYSFASRLRRIREENRLCIDLGIGDNSTKHIEGGKEV